MTPTPVVIAFGMIAVLALVGLLLLADWTFEKVVTAREIRRLQKQQRAADEVDRKSRQIDPFEYWHDTWN